MEPAPPKKEPAPGSAVPVFPNVGSKMWKIPLLSMNAPGIYGRSQILPGSRKWGFPGSTAARAYVKLPAFADQPAKKRGLSFP